MNGRIGSIGSKALTAAFYGSLLLALWLGFQAVSGADSSREMSEAEMATSQQPEEGVEAAVVEPVAAAATMPNIIFIVVDALRADHVSSYGYERPTTPNLDAIMAAEGVRFEEAITASSWTYPSNAAMLTGKMPSRLGVNWSDVRSSIPPAEKLLAEYLHEAGYHTAGFINNFYLTDSFGFNRGFDTYQTLRGSEKAEDLNSLALNWLDTQWVPQGRPQPLFLFLYYYDPHTWYDPPPPYDTLYDKNYTGTLNPDVYQHGQPVVARDIVPTPRDVEHLIALYDGEITYWDHHFGQIMAQLEAKGLLENSLIVVTSDHGQMFGEHDKWVHRNSLYEEVLRVPLFIRYDGVTRKGHVATGPVNTTDLLPTVLNLVGLPLPEGVDGISLRYQAQGGPGNPNRLIFAEMESELSPSAPGHWIAPPSDLRSVRQGDWKYIHHVGPDASGELYELQAESPYEQEDVYEEETQLRDRLLGYLRAHFKIPERFNFLSAIVD